MIKISPKIWVVLGVLSLLLNVALVLFSGTLIYYIDERWDREIACEYFCGDLGATGSYMSQFMDRCMCTVNFHEFHREYFEDGSLG